MLIAGLKTTVTQLQCRLRVFYQPNGEVIFYFSSVFPSEMFFSHSQELVEKLKKKVRVGGCRHMKYCLPMIPCSSNKVLIVALTGGLNPLHPRDFYSELMCLVIIYRVIQQVQSWWQSTVWDFLSIRLLLSVHRYLPFEKYNENNCPADRKPFCSRRTNSS